MFLSVCNLQQISVSLYEKVQCSPPTVVSSASSFDSRGLSVSTGGVWKPGKQNPFVQFIVCVCSTEVLHLSNNIGLVIR